MDYHDRIVRDPAICGGQPVIRGTRVLVRVILGYLAHGEPVDVIMRELPSLTEDEVRAVIAFAAASASEDLPTPSPMPLVRDQGRDQAGRDVPGKARLLPFANGVQLSQQC